MCKKIIISIMLLAFSGVSYSALFEYHFTGIVTDTSTDLLALQGADVSYIYRIDFDIQGRQTLYNGSSKSLNDSFYTALVAGGLIETLAPGWSTNPTDVMSNNYGQSKTANAFLCSMMGICNEEGEIVGESADNLTSIKSSSLQVEDWKTSMLFTGRERKRDTTDGTESYIASELTLKSVSAVPVPAAVWLFGTALIGFIGFSRRTSVS